MLHTKKTFHANILAKFRIRPPGVSKVIMH